MMKNKLFPDLKRVLRNAISVGIIASIANFQNIYPPDPQMLWTVVVGFIIAFGIEFANAYKNKPKPHGRRQNINTFFLSCKVC